MYGVDGLNWIHLGLDQVAPAKRKPRERHHRSNHEPSSYSVRARARDSGVIRFREASIEDVLRVIGRYLHQNGSLEFTMKYKLMAALRSRVSFAFTT